MYKTDTKRVILTRDVKWHGFDGENAANDPTLLDLTESKVHKSGRSLRNQERWGGGGGSGCKER